MEKFVEHVRGEKKAKVNQNVCPLKSAQAMGKKARAKAARRKRREDPNP